MTIRVQGVYSQLKKGLTFPLKISKLALKAVGNTW